VVVECDVDESGRDFGLLGRVAVVTGAARGIGAAAAQVFAHCGATVVCCDILAEEAARTMARLPDPERHENFVHDLSRAEECHALVDAVVQRYGRLDILANIAAILKKSMSDAFVESDWTLLLNTNLRSVYVLCYAASKEMARNHFGRVVNVASLAAFTGGTARESIYAITKGGIVTLTKSMAKEFAHLGITVNAVAPGFTDTSMLRDGLSGEELARIIETIPLRRLAEPIDIAHAIVFLASSWASYITGATIDVNGGCHMR
jgi:3-oxoacyl-[acyl-carrier protein] reductase